MDINELLYQHQVALLCVAHASTPEVRAAHQENADKYARLIEQARLAGAQQTAPTPAPLPPRGRE